MMEKKNEKRTFNIALYKNILKNITKWFKVSFRLITAVFHTEIVMFLTAARHKYKGYTRKQKKQTVKFINKWMSQWINDQIKK